MYVPDVKDRVTTCPRISSPTPIFQGFGNCRATWGIRQSGVTFVVAVRRPLRCLARKGVASDARHGTTWIFVRVTRLIYMLCFKYSGLWSFCPTLSAPYAMSGQKCWIVKIPRTSPAAHLFVSHTRRRFFVRQPLAGQPMTVHRERLRPYPTN